MVRRYLPGTLSVSTGPRKLEISVHTRLSVAELHWVVPLFESRTLLLSGHMACIILSLLLVGCCLFASPYDDTVLTFVSVSTRTLLDLIQQYCPYRITRVGPRQKGTLSGYVLHCLAQPFLPELCDPIDRRPTCHPYSYPPP